MSKFESSSAISKGLGNALVTISEVGSLPAIRGQWFFVDPTSGANTSDGRTIDTAVAGLAAAYAKASDGDGIALLSYGATSAATTSYLTAQLAWTKNGITVAGVCAPTQISPRARVANKVVVSTVAMTAVADTSLTRATGSFIADGWEAGMIAKTNVDASGVTIVTVSALVMTVSGTLTVGAHTSVTSYNVNLITLSGSNNRFYNISFWNGGASAMEIGGIVVTGPRNYFGGCHIIGGAGSASVATKSSVKLSAAEECLFEKCTIGTDTFDHAAHADAEVLLTGAVARNRFIDCEILARSTSTEHAGVRSDTTTGGRPTVFKNCLFNFAISTGTPAAVHTNTGAIDKIILFNCAAVLATAWGTGVYANMVAPAAAAAGGLSTTA